MKPIDRQIAPLIGAAFAVLAMLMVSSVSVAAPASAMQGMSAENCADMVPGKGTPPCSPQCALVCHALVLSSPALGKVTVFERVSYSVCCLGLMSVIVEGDHPPPR
jgi:hypothetical protein